MKKAFTLFCIISLVAVLSGCVKERSYNIHYYDDVRFGGVDTTKGLVINEICNRSCTYYDELNPTNPDHWVEIYNVTSHDIMLDTAHYYLTGSSGLTNPNSMYKLSHFTIPAHGYIVVFGDDSNQVTGNSMHANFHISKHGGFVGLYSTDASNHLTTLSTHSFDSVSDVAKGSSWGVYYNGSTHWQIFPTQTPGAANPHP